MPDKSAFYVDGFNLYHAINDLGEPHLKWLNLSRLAETLIPSQSERIVRIVYCTAIKTKDTGKMLRHRQYLKALKSSGVDCLEGHFTDEPRNCLDCRHSWLAPVEKQGDVNLAISLIDDGHRDIFDHAYLLSADGDQAATARLFKERFPEKKLTTVAPPGRSHSKVVLQHATARIALNYGHIERCIFPGQAVFNPDNSVAALRPVEYSPPPGWVHPDNRR